MRNRVTVLTLAVAGAFSVVLGQPSTSSADSEPAQDSRAVDVLNRFMFALLIADEEQSAKEAKKYVHKSLLNNEGTDLSPDLRRFSFKKARDGAKFYQVPVKVTRIRATSITAIGFKQTAELGSVIDYFIAKKSGVNGLPAPVKIFFPKSGGHPTISYIGSI